MYKPLSFAFVEIGTNSRIPTTPFVVQLVIKQLATKRWNKFRIHTFTCLDFYYTYFNDHCY